MGLHFDIYDFAVGNPFRVFPISRSGINKEGNSVKLLIAGLLTASTLAIAAPAAAQGVYIGPGGVGVGGIGVGADPYYGDRFDRDGYADDPLYQGRSVYRDRYDDYDDF